jgi:hypothetical protein
MLREEHRLVMFEKMMLRKIMDLQRSEGRMKKTA